MAHHSPGIVDVHIDRTETAVLGANQLPEEYRMLLGFVQRLLPSANHVPLSGQTTATRRRHPKRMKERMTLTNGTRKRLTVAIVGAGGVAETHAAVLKSMPQVRLTAICDSAPGKAEAFQQKFGLVGATQASEPCWRISSRRGTHRDNRPSPMPPTRWSV
jgi:hypothetical protein